MKKILADKDLRIGCEFVAEGISEAEVLRKATLHVREDHPGEWKRVKRAMKEAVRSIDD